MTRNYLLLAAAALAFAACGNDETDNWNGEIRLRSGLDVQQTTRAGTTIQATQFENGENIDVYIEEATQGEQSATTTYDKPLVYTTGSNGAMTPPTDKQPYYPSSGNGVNIFAVYPKGISLTSGSGSFTIKEDQSDDANYKASDLMYGAPTTNPVSRQKAAVSLQFKHLLSKVTVELVSGDGSPSLDGATVELQNVKPSTTLTATNSSGSISEASGDTKAIKVMKATSSSLSGSAIVIPQTLATSFIKVTLKDGGVLTSNTLTDSSNSAINSVVLASGKAYKYTITVNLTKLDVTSSIGDWGDETEATGTATMD